MSTSKRIFPPPHRGLLWLLVLTLPAFGFWRRDREEPPPEPEPEPEEVEPAPLEVVPVTPLVPVVDALFPPGALPAIRLGPLPAGLPNASAQGCNACHPAAHDQWAASAHAGSWASEGFQEAVTDLGHAACVSCHLPLDAQRADEVVHDPERPAVRTNPHYDPILHTEGVTCVTCHVRDGLVLAAKPVEGAPHPMGVAPDLGSSALCASCHQLTWPGADQPLYDTYGEWERSPHAQAGITCQDCHMGPGAGEVQAGARHDFAGPRARAVSVLVDLDRVALVRGGDALEVEIRLQNTGAGHAMPTGSPWRTIVLQTALVGPPAAEGADPLVVGATRTVLGRTLEEEPPWRTLEDTRLQPGGERVVTWSPALDQDAPGGPWVLEVTLTDEVLGRADPAPFFERRIPLSVD